MRRPARDTARPACRARPRDCGPSKHRPKFGAVWCSCGSRLRPQSWRRTWRYERSPLHALNGRGRAARAMAIVHIAIFEAVNAIDGGYQSYIGLPRALGDDVDGRGDRAGRARHARRALPVAEGELRRRCSPRTSPACRTDARPQTDGIELGQPRGGGDPRAARERRLAAPRAAVGHRLHPERRSRASGARTRSARSRSRSARTGAR